MVVYPCLMLMRHTTFPIPQCPAKEVAGAEDGDSNWDNLNPHTNHNLLLLLRQLLLLFLLFLAAVAADGVSAVMPPEREKHSH